MSATLAREHCIRRHRASGSRTVCLAVLVKLLPSSGSPPWCSPEPKDPQGSCRRQGKPEPDPLRLQRLKTGKRRKRILLAVVREVMILVLLRHSVESRPRLRSIPRRRGRTGLFRRAIRENALSSPFVNSRFHPPSIRRTIGGCIQQSGAVGRFEADESGDGMRRQHPVRLGGNGDLSTS